MCPHPKFGSSTQKRKIPLFISICGCEKTTGTVRDIVCPRAPFIQILSERRSWCGCMFLFPPFPLTKSAFTIAPPPPPPPLACLTHVCGKHGGNEALPNHEGLCSHGSCFNVLLFMRDIPFTVNLKHLHPVQRNMN